MSKKMLINAFGSKPDFRPLLSITAPKNLVFYKSARFIPNSTHLKTKLKVAHGSQIFFNAARKYWYKLSKKNEAIKVLR